MDPNAAWHTITDNEADIADRADAAAALMSWLDTGGFFPQIDNAGHGRHDITPMTVHTYCAIVLAEAWAAR